MPSRHALLSASASHRWLECTPCARLEATLPEPPSSPFATEGTQAHDLCEHKLKKMIGMEVPELAYEPDAEMDRCTDEYRDFIEEELNAARAKGDAHLFIEQELDLEEYIPEGFGTSDAVITSDDELVVIDFKYGRGVPVNAVGNPQLRLYALGAYRALSILFEFKRVRTIVFQPRLNSISSESLDLEDLLKWGDEVVKPRAAMAFEGLGEYKVGEHCRFCRAGGVCRARAEEAFSVIEHVETKRPTLSDAEIPDILAKADEVRKWLDSIEKYALEKSISEGVKWPGYKLVEGRTLRKITDPVDAANRLNMIGFSTEDLTNYKLKSLSELEKLVGKEKLNQVIGDLIVRPKGEPTLVKLTDKRPEINPLAEAFKEEN